jgi:hypothetical protein
VVGKQSKKSEKGAREEKYDGWIKKETKDKTKRHEEKLCELDFTWRTLYLVKL